MGGGTTGIEEALAACEQWRAGYSEVSLLLGCNDPDVDDPTYCDEFAANDCLLESGALWACERHPSSRATARVWTRRTGLSSIV